MVLNTNDSGPNSLRAAITAVNHDPQAGTDTIKFAIGTGVKTIVLQSALPTVTHAVLIDGTTQPGFAGTPLIELDGAKAGAQANGLTLSASNSTVKGLVINRFGGDGLLLTNESGDRVQGDFIGTDVTGTLALANGGNGVEISGGTNNTIGGPAAGQRNVISGNGNQGVLISGASASLNKVVGNYLGTDVTGTKALGNAASGVFLEGASNTTVGGVSAGAGNLISGNGQAGVFTIFLIPHGCLEGTH
jgi:hypothetical protein